MAKPRVFVSSTYYDLKHVRSSLELFIESLGYEPVLSEKGDIAYTPEQALDESCYREASSAEIFVLIIGGRYGSEVSGDSSKRSPSFFESYESITRKEFESAYKEDIPIYILIEKGVHSEYQTYQQNKENETIKYAHVDSVNVFRLIEDIFAKPRNNPLLTFERFSEIEVWLREQWAGFFRELLKTKSQQHQLLAISGQVVELKAINETLKTYLEALMTGMDKDQSTQLIESEEKRLVEARSLEKLRENKWCRYLTDKQKISLDKIIDAFHNFDNASIFATHISEGCDDPETLKRQIINVLSRFSGARADVNEARAILGLDPITKWDIPLSSKIDDSSVLQNREGREREKRESRKAPNIETR